jgi:hypothetical protein
LALNSHYLHRSSIRRCIVLVALLFLGQTLPSQDFRGDQAKALADAMLSQTGLRLPSGVPDIFSLISREESSSVCEEIDVRWVSLPGSSPLPLNKALSLQSAQKFSQLARREHAGCAPPFYRTADFPSAQFIVFGTSPSGEIRGLHAERDPRELIAECPELGGEKSTPDTVCGIMLKPDITASIHMPHDDQITQLLFFIRRFESQSASHLQRVGSLGLVSGKGSP